MSERAALVLVVDDERAIQRFLRPSLEENGFAVLEASNGKSALELAVSKKPDVILLDLSLPDMDGLDVLARLREWTSAPVIVVSARGEESDKIAGLDSGADDYLTKPFGVEELLGRAPRARPGAGLRARRPQDRPDGAPRLAREEGGAPLAAPVHAPRGPGPAGGPRRGAEAAPQGYLAGGRQHARVPAHPRPPDAPPHREGPRPPAPSEDRARRRLPPRSPRRMTPPLAPERITTRQAAV